MFKRFAVALVLAFVAGPGSAASLIDEGFADVSGLAPGWSLQNLSTPQPTGNWFQGNVSLLTAQAGPADSYIAASYQLANGGNGGQLDLWLITPAFSTEQAVRAAFFANAEVFEDFFDQIAFGFSTADTTDVALFTMGPPVNLTADGDQALWGKYTAELAAQGAGTKGRFAIRYFGETDTSNFIGIDTLTIDTIPAEVPEPRTYALLLAGLGLLGFAARRRRR